MLDYRAELAFYPRFEALAQQLDSADENARQTAKIEVLYAIAELSAASAVIECLTENLAREPRMDAVINHSLELLEAHKTALKPLIKRIDNEPIIAQGGMI